MKGAIYMHSVKKTLAAGLMAAITVQTSWAAESPTVIEFVRPLGMGGAFTALSDDKNAFTYNPAGMVQRTGGEVTIFEIVAGGSEDLKEAYEFIDENNDELTDFDTLPAPEQVRLANEIQNKIARLRPHAYFGADVASYVSGPLFKGVHLGFGLMGLADARFRLYNGAVAPLIDYSINSDVLLPVSLAKRWNAPLVPGKIGVGVTGKYIKRSQVSESRLSVFELDDIEVPPMTEGSAIGSDLGFLYQPSGRWNVGLMVRDFLGTKMKFDAREAEDGFAAKESRDTVIRPRTNIGVSVVPKSYFGLGHTSDRLTLSADVRDIFGKDTHVLFQDGFRRPLGDDFATNFHMGAEFRYWFLRLRGGAYQGYPTFGLGIDIPLIKIDYAFFSRELGARAGDIQEKNHVVSLALRFGSGKTEARERIKKSQELRKGVKADAPAEAETAKPEEPETEKPTLGDTKKK